MSKLTTAAIARYRPSGKRREIRDDAEKGLYLVIQPTGSMSWCMRFCRPDGTPSKLTLGRYDKTGKEMPEEPVIGQPLTLAAAHELATKLQRQRAMGIDVIAEQAAARHRRHIKIEQDAANTFPVLVTKFITEHAQRKTRRWHYSARLLGLRYPKDGSAPEVITGGLCDRWAKKPVSAIDGSDIYTIVHETQHLGVPGAKRRKDGQLTDAMARSMFSALSSFFGWCQKHRRVSLNPCTGVYRPEPPKKRDRVLTDDEIKKFWKACDTVGEPAGQVLKLLLLTGCRLREVTEMQRSELSENGTWTIPGTRTKNHLTHVVPLPTLARDLIASVKPTIAGKFVFTLDGKGPIHIGTRIRHTLDAAMNVPAWTPHDLRRTAATGMAGIGIAPHIVEACLNHVSGAKASVAGVYNRAAYEPEKKAALERWAAHVQGLVTGKSADNILGFVGKRGTK